MSIIPWPPKSRPPRPERVREAIADPLPLSVLHSLVAGLPGPDKETKAEQAARFEAQLAEVLSYNPRNAAEAMLATHCVLLRVVASHSRRDANKTGRTPAMVKKILRSAKQFDKLIDDMDLIMARRRAQTPGPMDPAILRSIIREAFPIQDADDAGQTDEAFSAVIVPLHPAPKLLQ